MRESEFSVLTGFTKEDVGGGQPPKKPPLAFRFLRQGLKTGRHGFAAICCKLPSGGITGMSLVLLAPHNQL